MASELLLSLLTSHVLVKPKVVVTPVPNHPVPTENDVVITLELLVVEENVFVDPTDVLFP